MKRKLVFATCMIFILMGCFGCVKKNIKKNPQKTINILKEIEAYTSKINIKIINDKQENEYKGKQTYVKNKTHKLELNNSRVLNYRKGNIYVNDLKNNSKYVTSENIDSVFKMTFVDEYIKLLYTNENVIYNYTKIDEKEYLILELDIPSTNKNLSKAKLFVDTETSLPSKITIYDDKDKMKMKIIYNEFKVNTCEDG